MVQTGPIGPGPGPGLCDRETDQEVSDRLSMKSLLVLLLLLVLIHRTDGDLNRTSADQDQDQVVVVVPDLHTVLHRVDQRFLSVTIDASLASEERFMSLLSSVKIRTLTRALSPAFLRFGGTQQDFMEFSPKSPEQLTFDPPAGTYSCDASLSWLLEERLKADWFQQQKILKEEELHRKFRKVQFTEDTVDRLVSFSRCCSLTLIFGLNALLRTSNNTWNSSNAHALMDYCQHRRYRLHWELGNEPNSFEKKAGIRVGGAQLGLDFTHLRKMMSQSQSYRHAGLYGPDIGQPRDHRTDMTEGFLQTGAEAINAFTWHHYYVNGRETSLKDFLDPDVLDTLALKTKEVLKRVWSVCPLKPVWLGETSSAFGGGAPGLSDTFAAGFMWMDKLGVAATLGLGVVMRQVLIGSGSYHMVDDNLDPLPDYWLSLLYKRLVGSEVLRVELSSDFGSNRRVRVYLHCAHRRYVRGALTLMSMNLSRKPVSLSLPSSLAHGSVEAFVLQSENQSLLTRSVMMNSVVMKMINDETLPDVRGRLLPASQLQLPSFSMAFFVLMDAHAAACS
uniref:Heparanase n=1 Tax=Gouania willdenowi TaxID=441366 RepID=A0A8C5DZ43_GOUWI